MIPTRDQLVRIAGPGADLSNVDSVLFAIEEFGAEHGLDKPHRLAHFIAQLAHESGGFRYDREVWGPTPAQQRYDTRTDLGNTPEVDGDGKKNAGKGPMQLTGAANIAQFEQWCIDRGYDPPDFSADPDLINTDPWEGLSAVFYWSTRKLNRYADENNIEQITKRINGGLNGFEDRIRFYVRTALVMLGYAPDDVKAFQFHAQQNWLLPADTADKKQVDGDAGPVTRAAMHQMLASYAPDVVVKDSPVVAETEVPKIPKGADKPAAARWWAALPLIGTPIAAFVDMDNTGKIIVAAIVIGGVVAMLFLGERIAARAKAIKKAFETE
jgi:putative chitinase